MAPVLAAEAFGAIFDVDGRCDKRDAGKNKITAIDNLKLKTEDFCALSVEEANGRLKVWMGTKGEREEGSGATSS